MQTEQKTIAVFFTANADTNSEAFQSWLNTCPFSNQTVVDFDYSAKPVIPSTTDAQTGVGDIKTGDVSFVPESVNDDFGKSPALSVGLTESNDAGQAEANTGASSEGETTEVNQTGEAGTGPVPDAPAEESKTQE